MHATYSGETNNSGSNFVAWAWDAGDNLAPTGFSAVTYTGNGGTQSISGLGFEPDLVWIKNRFAAYNHMLFDSVRGVGNYLESDTTDGEASGNHLISFNSDGFTVGEGSVSNRTNYSGNSYVAWAWDAGSGSPVSNTDGSITSTVKANASKGFSIATYTGDGTSGSTFGHGLGVTPDLVIVKRRNTTAPWNVYTSVTGETKYLELDSNAAVATATNRWNDTAPTSSVISLGNTNNVNGSGSTYVAYSFASISGYSKVSSYTGTGTADLAVTGLGFRPAVVIIKRTDSIDRWLISDSTRTPLGDTEGTNIFLDAANAESGSSTTAMTFDNDGFTLNGTNGMINASGGTYIYIAFAGGQDLISPVNTNGTITSRVKANTAKGFSIVSYTGTGANATVGHGLSSAPEIIIPKNRDYVSGTHWDIYASPIGAGNILRLNSTLASTASAPNWNSTAPTSSVFTVGTSNSTNRSGDGYIAYCFHSVSGYSSIGSYSGTGASGNSITGLGFKPAWIIIKETTNAGSWHIYDNTRNPVNPASYLLADTSNTEDAFGAFGIDFDSDGFTIQNTGNGTNRSGGTYIYMAFADTRDATFFGDTSGNGNNWTPNALKNTDVVPDSPVTGGNFATLNPIQSLYSNSVTTFSEGNLKAALGNASNWRSAVATQQHSSGKWYYEVYANQGANGFIGFGHDNFDINGAAAYAGATAGSWGWLVSGGLYNNTASIDTLSSYTTGDIISIALDFDNAKAYWAKNGIWENSADPAAGTGGTSIDADKLYKMGFSNVSGYASTANFGQDSSFAGNATPQGNTDDNGVGDFYYAPPTGFLALTTGNLPAPAITAPDDYFNTLLWTGDGTSSRALTNVGFQPDFNWVKSRSGTEGHVLHDSVRGSDAYGLIPLSSQGTAAESVFDATWHSNFGSLDSLDSDGFTVTDGSLSGTYNTSGVSYVAWNWLASNGTVSNTDGSITSTVSANQTAGFSVVGYTGTGANATVGHGLSSAPEMIIVKNRTSALGWPVYHSANGATKFMQLEITNAVQTASTVWQDTAPTSSVFSVGTSTYVNQSSSEFIAYCFAEVEGYSKIGSYTGNGSTDGTFVYCGFRPAFVMLKVSSTTENWVIFDNERSEYNLSQLGLYPNTSGAEVTISTNGIDMLSNGFKLKGTGSRTNGSGNTYIFLAFAEAPFKSANAR